MKLEVRIREFARANPLAYRVWFAYYRCRKSSSPTLPKAGDSLYLDGYPRSGNTYFTAAIKYMHPGISFANHLHVVAPVKIALQKKVPTFLLLRDPEEAVASYFLHVKDSRSTSSKSKLSDDDLCQALAREWLLYYRFVSNEKERIHLISADRAFKTPKLAVRRINDFSGLPEIADPEGRFASFHQSFAERDASKTQGSTSFPDPLREQQKEEARRLIRKCTYLGQCRQIHEELKERSILEL